MGEKLHPSRPKNKTYSAPVTIGPKSELEFLHCRARLQRLHDAAMLSGWVDQVSRNHCAVRLNGSPTVTLGESYYVELHGPNAIMTFKSTCSGIEGLEMAALGQGFRALENVLAFEPTLTVDLFLMSQPSYFPPQGDCRKKAEGLTANLSLDKQTFDVRIQDISRLGIGLIVGQPIKRGCVVSVEIAATRRAIQLFAEVRSCRDMGSGHYRIGLSLAPMDRLQEVVWRQIGNFV